MRARAVAPPRTIVVVKITREQAELLKPIVGRHQRVVNKLVDRLTRLGYAPDDPLFTAAVGAKAALQDLAMAIHYASCNGGVGAPATPMNYPPPIVKADHTPTAPPTSLIGSTCSAPSPSA